MQQTVLCKTKPGALGQPEVYQLFQDCSEKFWPKFLGFPCKLFSQLKIGSSQSNQGDLGPQISL